MRTCDGRNPVEFTDTPILVRYPALFRVMKGYYLAIGDRGLVNAGGSHLIQVIAEEDAECGDLCWVRLLNVWTIDDER